MPAYPHERETAKIMALAPVIPVLTVASVEDGVAQAKALVAGGLYAIEVTLRTPAALEAIKAIAKNVPKAVVGAGTIVSADQINQAVAAGAKFLVSPGAPAALAKAAAAVAGSVPAGMRDGLGSHGAQGAWLPGAETLSRRSGRRARSCSRRLRRPCQISASARPAASISRRRQNTCGSRTCPASAGRGCCRRPRLRRGTISRSKLCRATRRGSHEPPCNPSSRAPSASEGAAIQR